MNRHLAAVSLVRETARVGATLLLLLGACKKREETPPRPPGMADDEGRPLAVAPPKPAEPVAPEPTREAPTVYDFEHPSTMDPGALAAKPQPGSASAARPLGAASDNSPEPAARDLSAELSAKLEPVSGCIDAAQAAAQPDGRLHISVSAYVLGTGRVSRATVTAPGQPASALSCIEQQLLALSLTAPIPDAPIQVKGETQVQIKLLGRDAGQPPPAAGTIPPAARNPNVAKPEPGDVAKPEPGDVAGPP